MKTKIILSSIIILCFFNSQKSQHNNDTIIKLEKTIERLHLFPLGLAIEYRMVKHATLLVDFGAGFSYLNKGAGENADSFLRLNPYAAIEPRIYTNLQARKDRGKRTDFHSGAYGAFRIQGGLEFKKTLWYVQIGPLVGFQRTLGKSGYWNIGIGCGSTLSEEVVRFGLIGDLKLGFVWH